MSSAVRNPSEYRDRATRGVIASATGIPEPGGSSMGRPAQTPAVERSSEEETVTEGPLPAVERSSEEETVTVVGIRGSELRTPAVERSSGEETVTSSMRVGQRPSFEAEPATSSMLPVERPSVEVLATDIASGSHSVIGPHPPVDR